MSIFRWISNFSRAGTNVQSALCKNLTLGHHVMLEGRKDGWMEGWKDGGREGGRMDGGERGRMKQGRAEGGRGKVGENREIIVFNNFIYFWLCWVFIAA